MNIKDPEEMAWAFYKFFLSKYQSLKPNYCCRLIEEILFGLNYANKNSSSYRSRNNKYNNIPYTLYLYTHQTVMKITPKS